MDSWLRSSVVVELVPPGAGRAPSPSTGAPLSGGGALGASRYGDCGGGGGGPITGAGDGETAGAGFDVVVGGDCTPGDDGGIFGSWGCVAIAGVAERSAPECSVAGRVSPQLIAPLVLDLSSVGSTGAALGGAMPGNDSTPEAPRAPPVARASAASALESDRRPAGESNFENILHDV